MNTSFRDRLAFFSAIALGLGVSTGHSAGIIAAAGMPLACLAPGKRRAAFHSAFAYYFAGLWPILPGLNRYFRQSETLFIPLVVWIVGAILLSVPWTLAWTSHVSLHSLWRVPLAHLVTIVPPLGIIGVASPLTAAGYLFPGSSWLGLGAIALLPAVFLSTPPVDIRRRWVIRCSAIGFCLAVAIGGRVFHRGDVEPPRGWVAVNTHFGDVSEPFRDFMAARSIQQQAAASSARVLVFPEFVVPRWSASTEAFWRESLDTCRIRGQVLAIGAGLPARAALPGNDPERLSNLRSYDFAAAIDALRADTPSRFHSRAIPQYRVVQRPVTIDNTLVVIGAESATYYQRIPVPIGMWRPLTGTGVPLRLAASGILSLDHQRAAVLICYEQMLTFPILASMLQHPTVIVGISNTFWVDGTTIPRYQATAVRGWARLFGLPYLLAVNS